MAYEKTVWVNGQAPALDAEHLNKIEQGIADAVSVTPQTLSDDQKSQARGNINAAPGGYGLGENTGKYITSLAALDAIDKNGIYFYYNQNEAIGSYPYGQNGAVLHIRDDRCHTQFFFPGGTDTRYWMRTRYEFSETWGAWEFVKVPMDLGVEYRTTERYLGKPVYVKAVDCGEITNGKEITTGIYYSIKVDVVATSSYYSLPLPRVPFQTTAAGLPSNYSTAFYVNANKIIFICGTSGSGDHGTAIIRYTKTTD